MLTFIHFKFNCIRWLKLWPLMVALVASGYVWAQPVQSESDLLKETQRWLDQTVPTLQPAGSGALRMEVSIGALDSRLRLASCQKVEPYLPPGTRLWGRTRLGLRCMDGTVKWNVFLPVTVKAMGKAWVVKRDISSGGVLVADDLVESEVDWAEEVSPIVPTVQQWLGSVATRTLTTGQSLRQNMIRPAQVFQAGAQIRVVATGAGYQITSDGQALSAGVIGQQTRVRMDNGRIMTGLVLDARTVRLDL